MAYGRSTQRNTMVLDVKLTTITGKALDRALLTAFVELSMENLLDIWDQIPIHMR